MSKKLEKIIEILDRLISYDTTSFKSNLELIHYISNYLDGFNIKSKIIYDENKNKANLFATIGPDIDGGYVLSGHTDVVPVQDQTWQSDPFTLTKRNDRLFGRGTADMKSFIATALAYTPDFQKANLKLPIHFAFSYDEEVGCLGVHSLIADLGENLPKPSYVIVGEPTNLQLVNAHKGMTSFQADITGSPAHSSQTHMGVNAIEYALKLCNFLTDIKERLQDEKRCNNHFIPKFSSLNIGTIKGGSAVNIVPAKASLEWEMRLLPNDDGIDEDILLEIQNYSQNELLPKMREISPDCNIEIAITNKIATFQNNQDSFFENIILKSAKQNNINAVSYATEAGLFQKAGLETIICGPASIKQAHKPDEYIEISQLQKCSDFMDEFISVLAD